jgi:hypothetical protein
MRRSRRRVEEGLWVLGLHRFGRFLNAALDPQKRERLRNMRDFYAALLPPEGLVFDVGANVGILSALFTSLGHRVMQSNRTEIVFVTSRFPIPICQSPY